MAYETIFIDEGDLAELTTISANIDPRWVRPTIRTAQDVYVEPALGRAFYDYLIAAIDGATLLPEDVLLLAELRKAVVHYALAEAANGLTDRMENAGMLRNQDATYVASLAQTIALRKSNDLSRGHFYLDRALTWLRDYIKANPAAFPLFRQRADECCDERPARRDANGIGLYRVRKDRGLWPGCGIQCRHPWDTSCGDNN